MPIKIEARQSLLNKVAAVLSFLCLVSLGGTLSAATVSSQKSDDRECEFLLQGEIRTGDSDQLSKQISSFYKELELNGTYWDRVRFPIYICLDSPGGSLLEGVELAKTIKKSGLSTRIPNNSECLSACSIAFMAGSFNHHEGEVSFTMRNMHPTARLGFHAPSLNIQQGQYNEESVKKAYDVALQAVAAVSDLRVSSIEEFAESIFIKFLRTPSSTFTYIDTVGAATRIGIAISPVPVFDGELGAAVLNLCHNAHSRYDDTEPGGVSDEFLAENDDWLDGVIKVVDGRILFYGGFYDEATVPCVIEQSDYLSKISGQNFHASFPEALRGFPVYLSSFGASATYPRTTLISELPVASKSQTVKRINLIDTIPSKPINLSCGVADNNTRIVNVQDYTNFRKEAGLNGRVIGQISLGETVSVVNPGNYRRYDRCASACNGSDQSAIKTCIDNNDVWIEVQYNGRGGFLSRKFLQ